MTDNETLNLAAIPSEAREYVRSYSENPGGDASTDRLLDILSGVLPAARRMEEQKIPNEIIRATLADIGLWTKRCRDWTGSWGVMEPQHENWLRLHVSGKIFRVGRMQFCPSSLKNDWNVRVYKNKINGTKLVLTAGYKKFRADGEVSGSNGIEAGGDGFEGYFKEYDENGKRFAEGVVISPYGKALDKTAKLDLSEWETVLAEGFPAFDLHIPSDGAFDPAACRDSFERIVAFSKTHSQAIENLSGLKGLFNAFKLGSWLIDAQLDGVLPPESNLVKYLREFYLIPAKSDHQGFTFWVFDRVEPDANNPASEHTRTSLQRSVLDHMRKGGAMRYNLGIMMFEDVKDYGSEKYRRNFDEISKIFINPRSK